ncbi:MAG: 50S ribosomal protein L19 [Planctomycetota bacterium]
MNIIDVIEKEQMKKTAPQYDIGDYVDVSVKIIEGDKERIQVFRGIVIAKNGGGFKETFTVRRIVQGEGVERVFPIHSPKIVSVKVIKSGKVRRAKLYYMRERTGKGTRLQEKFEKEVPASAGEVLPNPNKNNT